MNSFFTDFSSRRVSCQLLGRQGLLLAGLALAGAAQAQTPTFALQGTVATGLKQGSRPNSVAIADVNGDGKPDALVTNNEDSSLGVLLGNGTGGFVLQTPQAPTGIQSNPFGVVVADVNGDGKPDALVTNYVASTLAVLLGNGAGGFTLQPNPPSTGPSSYPSNLAAADVNGDGKLDVLTTNVGSSTLGVLLGNGAGGFTLQANSSSTGNSAGPLAVAIADVNGDNKPDALVTNDYASTLAVLLGNGAGGFTLQANAPSTGASGGPHAVVLADVNGDGKRDALVANTDVNTLAILLGDGAGGFTLQATAPSTGPNTGPYNLAVADVNRDGKLDVLTANTNANTVSVLLGNGAGGFTLQANSPSTGANSGPLGLAVADVNNDGRPDVLTANINNGTLSVLLNTTVLATRAALPGTSASLYPNPAHAAATLAATGLPGAAHGIEATLYNALGQAVRHLTLSAAASAAQAELPTAGLPAGIYLVRLAALDAQGLALGALPTQHLRVE